VGRVAAVVGVLVVTDLALLEQSALLTVPVACLSAAILVGGARRAGMSWADLGLGRADAGRGLRWGTALACLVIAGYTMFAVVPWLDAAFTDARTPDSAVDVLLKVLLVIPLRTVLIEEIAFRGLIWGAVDRRHGPTRATVVSSAGFGLWHVPQAFLIIDANEALSTAADGSTPALGGVVLGIVLFTGLAGAVLAELRRRSGSLLTPMCLHLAVNAAGTVVSFLA
jgi:membrane protease YdiL (CAAX protease family)